MVLAITETGVEVTFEELTVDLDGAEVEVIDPADEVHPVEPLDLEAGDTTATFEFVTPVELIPGVWTVNGVEYVVVPVESGIAGFVFVEAIGSLNTPVEEVLVSAGARSESPALTGFQFLPLGVVPP